MSHAKCYSERLFYAHSYTWCYANGDSYGHRYSYTHAQRYADRQRDDYSQAQPYCQARCNTEVASHTSAAAKAVVSNLKARPRGAPCRRALRTDITALCS